MSLSDTKEAEETISKILSWFCNNGGWIDPNVVIHHDSKMGYQLRAKADLKAPFDAICCPLGLTLSHLNLDPTQQYVPYIGAWSKLEACRGKLSNEVLTRLLLIEQLVLEEESPWAPYIALIPGADELTTAMWFDSRHFENTPVQQAKREREEILKKEWKKARSVMQEVGLEKSEVFEEADL